MTDNNEHNTKETEPKEEIKEKPQWEIDEERRKERKKAKNLQGIFIE